MRMTKFVPFLRERFPLTSNHDLAVTVARAIESADLDGQATFAYDGGMFTITSEWIDGCYRGDCNPATCYQSYTLEG